MQPLFCFDEISSLDVTFHRFNHLPPELRMRIWKMAALESAFFNPASNRIETTLFTTDNPSMGTTRILRSWSSDGNILVNLLPFWRYVVSLAKPVL